MPPNETDYNDLPLNNSSSDEEVESISLQISPEAHGERLDRVLADQYPDWSRSRLQRWIKDGAVRVDGQLKDAAFKVLLGQTVEILPQADERMAAFAPENIPLNVVFQDASVTVIDKPPGMVVHPAAGNWSGTLLNALLHHDPDAVQLPRAGIVHRLDKDTSGLMVVARTLAAQLDLVRQLQERTVQRLYCALCWGETPLNFEVNEPIGRDRRDRTKMSVARDGKEASTRFARIAVGKLLGRPVSVLGCSLKTGRTHQIRVHLEHLGHPLLGDRTYHKHAPGGEFVAPRQALHAAKLSLIHPKNSKTLSWRAGLASDLHPVFEKVAPLADIEAHFDA